MTDTDTKVVKLPVPEPSLDTLMERVRALEAFQELATHHITQILVMLNNAAALYEQLAERTERMHEQITHANQMLQNINRRDKRRGVTGVPLPEGRGNEQPVPSHGLWLPPTPAG